MFTAAASRARKTGSTRAGEGRSADLGTHTTVLARAAGARVGNCNNINNIT